MKFNTGDRVTVAPNQDWNNPTLLKKVKSCDYAIIENKEDWIDGYWCNIVLHGVVIDSCLLMGDELELLK